MSGPEIVPYVRKYHVWAQDASDGGPTSFDEKVNTPDEAGDSVTRALRERPTRKLWVEFIDREQDG